MGYLRAARPGMPKNLNPTAGRTNEAARRPLWKKGGRRPVNGVITSMDIMRLSAIDSYDGELRMEKVTGRRNPNLIPRHEFVTLLIKVTTNPHRFTEKKKKKKPCCRKKKNNKLKNNKKKKDASAAAVDDDVSADNTTTKKKRKREGDDENKKKNIVEEDEGQNKKKRDAAASSSS